MVRLAMQNASYCHRTSTTYRDSNVVGKLRFKTTTQQSTKQRLAVLQVSEIVENHLLGFFSSPFLRKRTVKVRA